MGALTELLALIARIISGEKYRRTSSKEWQAFASLGLLFFLMVLLPVALGDRIKFHKIDGGVLVVGAMVLGGAVFTVSALYFQYVNARVRVYLGIAGWLGTLLLIVLQWL